MKSKKVLAQLAALSLAFGIAGTGNAWADQIIISGTDTTGTASGITLVKGDDNSFSVSDQSVKGVWLTDKAKLTANNVNFVNGGEGSREVGLDSGSTLIMSGGSIDTEMDYFTADGGSKAEINNAKVTTGAWANNSTITLTGCTTTGDVLYAGNEWGEGNVAEGLPEGRLTIDGGTANVGNVLVQNKAVFTVTNKATLDLTGDTSTLPAEVVTATDITNKGNITVRAWGPNTATSEKGNNTYVQSKDQAAQLRVNGGSTVKADTIDLYGKTDDQYTDGVKNVYRGKMVVSEKSSVTANKMNVGAYGYSSFDGSQLTVNGKLSITGIGYEDNYKYPYGLEINGGSATLHEVSLTSWGEMTLNDTTVTATNISNDSSIMTISGSTLEADAIDLKGHKDDDTTNIYRGKMYVSGNSSITADTMNVGAYGYGSFTDSQLTVNKKLSIEGLGEDDEYDKPYGVEINGGKATLNEASVTKYGSLSFKNGVKATLGDVTASGEGSTIQLTAEATNTPDVTISKLVLKDQATVDISAGKLTANSIDAADGTKIEIKGSGLLSTMSDQVYTTSAANNAKDSGDVKSKAFVFTAGTLELTDATYTKDYLNAALAALSTQTAESTTSLIMSGKQVDESGEEIKTNTIDEMKNKSDGVILDQTTVTSDKNFLIGTETTLKDETVGEVKVDKQIANGFGAKDLTLQKGEGNVGVVITNDKTLTLGGKAGGELISVVDSTGAAVKEAVKVVVGTTDSVVDGIKTAGTFTIGNAAVDTATQYHLNGEVLVNKDSALNVNGQATISDGVTLNSATIAVKEGASLETKKLDVTESSALTGATKVTEKVTIESGKVLSVGSAKKAGQVTVEEVTGGMVFLDPVWDGEGKISDASGFAVKKVSALDSALVVGQNSKLALGDATLDDVDTAFGKTGISWSKDGKTGVTAAVYVASTANVASGSITADGSLDTPGNAPNAGTVDFKANSLLMVNGAKVTGDDATAAITGVKSTSIDAGSTLYIDNAKKGEIYKILASADQKLSAKWADDKVISSNALLVFKADTDIEDQKGSGDSETKPIPKPEPEPTPTNTLEETTKNSYLNYEASVQSVKKVYGDDVIAPDVIDKAANGEGALTNFIMDKAVQSGVNSTKAAQVSALNSAMELSELAGAARGAYTTAGLVNDAVTDHMSIVHEYTHDKDVWAKYIHNKDDVDGLSIAGKDVSYKNKYNGIVVGADLYHNEKATVGLALTYGDGDITGSTLAAYTKNDAKYYGATIYGGIHNGDTAFLGDISYLHSKNDITQTNSGETITGTEKSKAFSIGVRAERSVKAGEGQFVPYAGLRYMHLSNGSYTDSLGLSHDGGDMNLWLLPVGVKYSMDAKNGGWTLRPIAEIGYVWNMGDRDARETVSFDGTSNSFGYDVTDNGSFLGHLGFEAEKGNTTFGIGYQYQKGDDVKSNRWSASVNYRF